jgi:hypothetical protein
VTNRKKKIILVQFAIFFLATFLLYNTYRDKDKKSEMMITETETVTDPNANNFTDIQYSGFDLNGNRYTLNAGSANFKTDTPESINMKNVQANFYLKDDTILKVTSRSGLYNNLTLDMNFREDVKATYSSNTLYSDLLNYSNSSGKLLASGNVRGESVEKGEFTADKVEYNLSNKTLDFSMLGNKQVNIKIKN